MSTIPEASVSKRRITTWLEAILDALCAFGEASAQHQPAVDIAMPQVRRRSAATAAAADAVDAVQVPPDAEQRARV